MLGIKGYEVKVGGSEAWYEVFSVEVRILTAT
jgi:hypothetical protein